MSKVESPSPKKLPAPQLKSVPDPIPLPPLFWDPSADEPPKPLRAPIHLVWVQTRDKSGEIVPVDCCPLGSLPEFPHQLADKYPGHAFLELTARAVEGTVLSRVTHKCRPLAAAAAPPAPAAAGAPSGGSFDAMAVISAVNARTDALMGMMLKDKDAAHAAVLDVVKEMAGARIRDAQEVGNAVADAKRGNAAPQSGELNTFLKGIKWAQGMMAAGGEGVTDGEDGMDLEDLLKPFLENFMRAKGEAAGASSTTPPRPTRDTTGEETQ